MIDLWYKNALIYCLDVETYQDGDGDGTGDFAGLTQRLDHIDGLGVTCLWLLPFHPSPNRDNGYDVADYYGVDPRLGTLGDFVEFTHQAHERGIRVLMDLVINHTSDQHPWFRAACADPESRFRDYYIWSAERPADAEKGIVFPGVQDSTWSWSDEAGAWYFHRFMRHQPDLNLANPAVREEIQRIMGFWLQLGVSGFRVDAAPFVIEQHAVAGGDPHAYLGELRDFLSWRRGDAVLLAEANVAMDRIGEFFGDGDRMHMLFNFQACQALFLALARQQAAPLAGGLRALPDVPMICQWANFVRNHDELDLSKLTPDERNEVARALAPDPGAWLFERGVRRRLPPMVDGDPRRIRLAYSVMLSLPGTPVLRYGEEIGMGDDLSLPDRTAVRTPMQWSDDHGAGFTTAPPDRMVRPVIADGPYGCHAVNVAGQRRDPDSLLNWMKRAIDARRNTPELGWGAWEVLDLGDDVLGHRCVWRNRVVIALHNFAARERTVHLPDEVAGPEPLAEIFGDGERRQDPGAGAIRLAPFGFRWLRVGAGPG